LHLQKIDERQKLEDVKSEFKQAIIPRCGCEFDIDNEMFSCQEKYEDTALFKARIVVCDPVSVTDANDVGQHINDWIKEMPNINVSNIILTVGPVKVESEDFTTATNSTIDSDSSSIGTIAGAVTAGVVTVTVVITVVVIFAIYCSKRRRKLRYCYINELVCINVCICVPPILFSFCVAVWHDLNL